MKKGSVIMAYLAVLLSFPVLGWTYVITQYPTEGTYEFTNSGSYLGTVLNENDSLAVVQDVLAQLGQIVTLTFNGKGGGDGFSMTSSTTEGGNSGTWHYSAIPPSSAQLIDFYVVKGGNEFALYQVVPALSFGTWNVGNLRCGRADKNVPTLSHFSGYAGPNTTVPEPGTMMLLGSGLVGLAVIRRRQRRN